VKIYELQNIPNFREFLGSKDEVNKVVGTVHALGRLGLSSPEDDRHVLTIICEYVRRVAPHRISSSGEPADMTGQVVNSR
jgi:hypothetical protein